MARKYPYPAGRFTAVGTVTRSHGLRGEFKVSALRGSAEIFETYSRAALAAADGRMTELLRIERCRVQGSRVILKLDTIDSKNEADLIVSMEVLVPSEDLAESDGPAEQPYRLIGASVLTAAGRCVGTLVDVSFTGGPPLLVIADGTDEYLVPLVDEIVRSIDDGRIVIDPPEGLLEINREGTGR